MFVIQWDGDVEERDGRIVDGPFYRYPKTEVEADRAYVRFKIAADHSGVIRQKNGTRITIVSVKLFDANAGTVDDARRSVETGEAILVRDSDNPAVEDPERQAKLDAAFDDVIASLVANSDTKNLN